MAFLLVSRLKKLVAAEGASQAGGHVPPRPENYRHTAVILALAILALRLVILSNQAYPLYGDEAQYWAWGQNLAWGYFSKPPLVAWLIRLSGEMVGDGEFGVRFFAPVLHFITQMLIFALGRRSFGAPVGLAASLIYGVMPGVAISGLVMSTDAPLVMFWAMALFFAQRILLTPDQASVSRKNWLNVMGLGLALGLGMLSKYFMFLFLVPLIVTGLLMAMNQHHRAVFKQLVRQFAIALAIGLMIFAPNIWWNYTHAWVSVHHTQANAGVITGLLHLNSIGEFLLSQFAVFGPLAFLVLLLGFWHGRRFFTRYFAQPADPAESFTILLYLSCLVPILFIVGIAALSRAHANWAGTAYVGGSVLVAAYLANWANWAKMVAAPPRPMWRQKMRQHMMAAILLSNAALVTVIYGYHDGARLLHIQLTGRTDPFTRFEAGRVLGRAVSRIWLQHGMIPILTDHRMVYASLAFYMRPAYMIPSPILVDYIGTGDAPADHFQMISPIAQYRDQAMIYITAPDYLYDSETGGHEAPPILAHFRKSEIVGTITIPLYPDYRLRYRLYLVQGQID
ncbi:MAG: glycosyltransferase family 39 protein [Candidatus Symbiobacter sp.]|nr:glycosyltransferase family 39 protein [Candidatus Symbiobacter sp.]